MRNRSATLRARDQARAQYEHQGYRVTLEERLPAPFEGFVADAVARRGTETIIIEIRSSDMSDATRNRFRRLGEIVSDKKNWRIDLVTFEPEAPLPPTDGGDVVRRIKEARRVADLSIDAAVMLTWSAAEGALRQLDHRRDKPQRHLSASRHLIHELVIDGLLSEAQADHLDRFARIRNHIAHGLMSRPVDQDDLDWVAGFALAAVGGEVATIENMIEWFRGNYEPPDVAGLPYDSEDGRYMWFGRGPHHVDDVLWEHFPTALESDIAKATEILEYEAGFEWAEREGA